MPKLDRRVRSVPDARTIGDDLSKRGVKLQLGASIYDLADPMGKLFFNILAEFEADLIRMRTREGMALARSKGKLHGKKPKLSKRQQKELRRMYDTGEYSTSDLAEVFSISWQNRLLDLGPPRCRGRGIMMIGQGHIPIVSLLCGRHLSLLFRSGYQDRELIGPFSCERLCHECFLARAAALLAFRSA